MKSKSLIPDPEKLYERATKAEIAKDLDNAFNLYLQAGSAFLNLSRASTHPQIREQACKDADRAVERAERIKAAKQDLAPVLRDPFALEEQQVVLRKGSIVNRLAVPLWTGTCSEGTITGTSFSDPDGFPELSPEQKEAGVVWRRPSEVFANAKTKIFSPELCLEDIVQRVVADCSLCASIIVCLLHSRTHDSEAALPSLYPRGPDGRPRLSSTGGYELKVLFNGTHRRVKRTYHSDENVIPNLTFVPPSIARLWLIMIHVYAVIDDCLPFRSDGCRMCLTSRGRMDIWPSLVEKAYLKLMGGYDFPGSDSSTDVHALTGWIPDYLEIKSPSFQREQTWSRLVRNFGDGRCVLTVGTDNRPIADWGHVKLLPAHCYAVIDIKETENGSRWLTVLDSWLPRDETDDQVDSLLEDLSLDNEGDNQKRFIDIAWDDVCALFGSICINWNPAMFGNQLLYHGIWRATHLSQAGRDESFHQTLRLLLEHPNDAQSQTEDVWIHLTRHRTDTRRSSEFISLHADYDYGHLDAPRNFASTAKTEGVYTDHPHVLVRVNVPSRDTSGTITMSLSYDGPFEDIGFTVTAYSGLSMRWDETIRTLPFDLKISGALTAKTSGGNYTLATYMINPQYRLRVPTTTQSGPPARTRVEVLLHAPRDLPVNAMVTWGGGERVFDVVQSDIVATSGAYKYGFAHFSTELPEGDFTLTVSAFSPTHQGAFTLLVCSSRRVEVDSIPQEGAGMFNKTLHGKWGSSGRPKYTLELPTPANVKIRLQPHAPAFVRIELFSGTGRPPLPLTSSGAFTDARSGAVTSQVALRAGRYIIGLGVDGMPGADDMFCIVVYSSSAGIRLAPLL